MPEEGFDLALAEHQDGRLAAAEALYRDAATAGHPAAAVNLAVLCMQDGRAAEAVQWARRGLLSNPDSAAARSTLATTLLASGEAEQAVAAYEQALDLDSGHSEAQYGLACALRSLGRSEEALACYRRALVLDPDYAEAELGLAELLHTLGQQAPAIAAYRRALDIDPDYPAPRLGLARLLAAAGLGVEAEAEYRALLAACPDHRTARAGLAALLASVGRPDGATALWAEAVASDPADPEAHRHLGRMLAKAGRLDEAAASLERAIGLAPLPAYFRELATLRPIRSGDPHLAAMRAAEAALPSLSPADRVELHFALGRALTDSGDPADGFAHLVAGNALHRAGLRYDEAGTLALHDRIREVFTPQLMPNERDAGAPSPLPIFLVGMPRCGARLVGQILASHGRVHSGGESPAFGDAVAAWAGGAAGWPYPELAQRLGADDLAGLARDYLSRLGTPAGAARATDTMLANSLFVGLIHLALPGARIVHVQRDPLDTCLSCFGALFTPDQPFAYDLGELGRFHRAHTRLMRHWHELLPGGAMLAVRYEALIAGPEAQARRLLAFCGLDWDPRVLAACRPRETPRPWRPDDAVLEPLLEGLAGRAG
jgi:tetratricopeptide (TPR) repeat protein